MPAKVDPRTGYRGYDVGQLAEHETVMRQRLAVTERIVAELQSGLADLGRHAPVHVRDEPARYTVALAGQCREEGFAAFLGEVHPTLGAAAAAAGAVLSGPSGGSTVHTGPYDSLDVAYRTLGAWAARFAQPSGEWVREVYLTDPSTTADPAGYRTEICWPSPRTRRSTRHDSQAGQCHVRLRRHARPGPILV